METVAHCSRRSRDRDSISVTVRHNQVALPIRQLWLENFGRDEVESSRPIDGNLAGRLLKSQADIRGSGSFLDDFINSPIRNDQLSPEIEEVWLERTAGESKQDNSSR